MLTQETSSRGAITTVRAVETHRLELSSLLRRERRHLPEAGAIHLQHRLGDLSSWSGVHGSLPPQQVSDASQNHISTVSPWLCTRALYYHGMEPNQSVSQREDVLARHEI